MIGIFDSGIGGLTVVKAVMDKLPGYDIVYFGDTARTPYGNKSARTVNYYSLQDSELLIQNGARIIVAACNTASSLAYKTVAERVDLPVFEVITPAVEAALKISRTKRIGVIGTRATIESGIYTRKINDIESGASVFSTACPLLVPLVEEGWVERPETRMIVKKYLFPLKTRQIDTLVLGCTHYPVLKKTIQNKIGRRVQVVDSSHAVADRLALFLNAHPEIDRSLGTNGRTRLLVSDITPHFKSTAQKLLRKNVVLEMAKVPSDVH